MRPSYTPSKSLMLRIASSGARLRSSPSLRTATTKRSKSAELWPGVGTVPSGHHAWNLHGSGELVSDLNCAEFVELVTAFLDGTLDPITERRLVDHLPNCVGCERYFDQFRQTIRSLGQLPAEGLRTEDREALMTAFRDWPR